MIISHKYKFIFIKTRKTAGSSIQIYLSKYCGEEDVLTPIDRPEQPYAPRNYRGLFNPIPEFLERKKSLSKLFVTFCRFFILRRYQSHIKARELRERVPRHVWDGYYKFAVERNPWDKVLSHYNFVTQRYGRYKSDMTFDEYLEVAELPYNYTKYTDLNGDVIVDRVIRYENLTAELCDVFGKLGVPFNGSLGTVEKSHYRKDKRHYREVYTPEQKAKVEKLFQPEIELMCYEF